MAPAASGIAGVLGILTRRCSLLPGSPCLQDDPAVVASATHYIQIVGAVLLLFFKGLGMSLYFASQGASFMLWPVVAHDFTRSPSWPLAPCFLASGLDLGLQGIYYAAAFAMMVYALIIAFAIRLGGLATLKRRLTRDVEKKRIIRRVQRPRRLRDHPCEHSARLVP